MEGLPALRSLMQSAVVQGRQADTTPAPDTPSATAPVATPHATLLARHAEPTVPTTPRPFGSPDPFADDALIDRVIDRLDERLRELSIRHLGFTGGLGA